MSQLLIAVDLLKKTVGEDISRHLIATTDREKGNLIKIAKRENLTTFIVPDGVGGRFSELCPVGLIAAAVCNIDIRALVAGAAPVPASAATNILAAVRIVQGESDQLHPEASVRAAAERIGGEDGYAAEIDLQLGSTHKTVVDDAFSDDALEWLLNPPEEAPAFPPPELSAPTPAAAVFGTIE